MHGCIVQWSHCSHSKSHHNILRCTAQNTSKWLRHLHLLTFCQCQSLPAIKPLNFPQSRTFIPPSFFHFFLSSCRLTKWQIDKMDKLLLFSLSTTHSVISEQQDNCLTNKTRRQSSLVYISFVSSSANSAMMSCTQMSLSSCEVSTRKTVNFLSQGLEASCMASSWATSGFFSTWFLKTMEASSDHCLGFNPARGTGVKVKLA